VIETAKRSFSGIATLGWDHPTHFPIEMLEELRFQQLERFGHIASMWLPLQSGAQRPAIPPAEFKPQDLSSQGLLALESASSSRCPYSIHNAARLKRVIDAIPDRERIRHLPHLIDTPEEALRWSISPRG
jgi:hypothetical protein